MVLGVIFALVLLAVPLYLLRKPSKAEEKEVVEAPVGFSPSVPAGTPEKKEDERFSLGELQRVKCSSAQGVPGKTGQLCDELPFFDSAFAKAIGDAFDCAPRTGDGGTLNYVLTIDFSQNKLHVFPGASGMWKGPQARRATDCVKRALPAPDWEKIPHEFRYYELAFLVTYKPPAPTAAPLFE